MIKKEMNPIDKFLNIERIDEYTYCGCETCGSEIIDTCLCIRDPDLFFRKTDLYKIKIADKATQLDLAL